jgi:hypothetical protein
MSTLSSTRCPSPLVCNFRAAARSRNQTWPDVAGLLLCLLAGTAPGLAEPPATAQRIGDFTAEKWGGFDVAVDERRDRIHFVYREYRKGAGLAMYHTVSRDGGRTWSEKIFVDKGHQMDVALDRNGDLHLVYGHEKIPSSRYPADVMYRVFRDGSWSAARRIDGPSDSRVYQMRIAVDGSDHVHVLYHDEGPAKFYPNAHQDDWRDDRMVYVRKTAAGVWEPAERWKGSDENEGCLGGDMFIDAGGDVHFVYIGGNSTNWKSSIERRFRRKTGEWGATLDYPNMNLSLAGMMWKFGGQFDAKGRLHIGGMGRTAGKAGVKVWVFEEFSAKMPAESFYDPRGGRMGVDLLLDPSGNGDIWVAGGNWNLEKEFTADTRQAFYYRYDAVARQWSERRRLSPPPPAAVNQETFWDTTPKLRVHRQRVLLFYHEQRPGRNGEFWMRVFAPTARREVREGMKP